jgi:ABC-type sulfate transport system permease component
MILDPLYLRVAAALDYGLGRTVVFISLNPCSPLLTTGHSIHQKSSTGTFGTAFIATEASCGRLEVRALKIGVV